MATKEAVFKLRVDTGNSVQDVTNADKAIKSFNTTIKDTQKTTSDNKASQNFAAQLDAIKAKVEAGGLGIRELSRVIREYQSLAIAAGEDSVIGRESIAAAGELKDRIQDLQNQTRVASSDFQRLDLAVSAIGTGAAVFQGLQSAIALTGVENENLVKTMVKLQAAQGIANAVSQVANALNKDAVLGIQARIAYEKIKNFVIGQTAETAVTAAAGENVLAAANTTVGTTTNFATLSMRAFRLALISTGIGALIVGVGYLISNLGKLASMFGKTESEADKLAKAQKFAEQAAREETAAVAKESSGFLLLASRIKETTNGSKERKALVSQMNTQYGTTLTNLKDEAKFQFAVNQEVKNYIAFQRAKFDLQKNDKAMQANFEKQDKLQRELIQAEKNRVQAIKDGANETRIVRDRDIGSVVTYTEYVNLSAKRILDNSDDIIKKNTQLLKEAKERVVSYGLGANKAGEDIEKLTNGGKKFVEQKTSETKSHKENTKSVKDENDELEKQQKILEDALNDLKDKLERDQSARDQAEDIEIASMSDGKKKKLAILEDTFGDFTEALIIKANKKELAALDKKFTSGKISEVKYRDELRLIMQNGSKKFSEDEIALMEAATNKFNDDKRRLNLTAQELEIDDANKALKEDAITLEEHAQKILEINDKYTKIERDKAAKKENDRRASNAFVNAIILKETEVALINEELAFIDSKNKLKDLLNSTNEDEKITQEQHDKALIELEKNKQKAIDKIKEDGVKKARELATKQFLEENENLNKFIADAQKAQAFAQEINSVLNDFADQRLQENANKRDADLANLDAAQQKELSQIGLTDQQKKQIEEKFAMQKYKIQLAAFNAEDKINRAKFARDKALKMTGIVINTAEAVMKSIANNGGVPAGIPFGIASGILGAAQLAVVANSKYQSGAAPTMPQLSSGGDLSGASGGQLSTPSTPQSTTLTSGLPGVAAPTSGQVFVLESDITAVQNTVFVAEAKTKF